MAARYPAVARRIRDAIGDPAPHGSLSRLARAVGTSVATVSRWYSLTSSPDDPAGWPAIEAALGLPDDSLRAAAFGVEEPAALPATMRSKPGRTGAEDSPLRQLLRTVILTNLDATSTGELQMLVVCSAYARARSVHTPAVDATSDPEGFVQWNELAPTLDDVIHAQLDADTAWPVIDRRFAAAADAWSQWRHATPARPAAAHGAGQRVPPAPSRSTRRSRPSP